MPTLQFAADQADYGALDGEVVRRVQQKRGETGVVTAEHDESIAFSPLHADAFQRWLAVNQTGADPALDVFGIDAGAVMDQHNVTWFESRLHAVIRESEAKIVR